MASIAVSKVGAVARPVGSTAVAASDNAAAADAVTVSVTTAAPATPAALAVSRVGVVADGYVTPPVVVSDAVAGTDTITVSTRDITAAGRLALSRVAVAATAPPVTNTTITLADGVASADDNQPFSATTVDDFADAVAMNDAVTASSRTPGTGPILRMFIPGVGFVLATRRIWVPGFGWVPGLPTTPTTPAAARLAVSAVLVKAAAPVVVVAPAARIALSAVNLKASPASSGPATLSDVPSDVQPGWGALMAAVLPSQPVALGGFEHLPGSGSLDPATPGGALYGSQFQTYSDGPTANDGRYDLSSTVSVNAATSDVPAHLDIWTHDVDYQGSAKPTAAVVRPKLTVGGASVRSTIGGKYWWAIQAVDGDGYGLSLQLIRDDQAAGAAWPDDGEVNMGEGGLTSVVFGGNYHPAQGAAASGDTRTPQQRDELNELRVPGAFLQDITIVECEWRPPNPDTGYLGEIRLFRNGSKVPFFQTRDRVPPRLMMHNLQAGPHTATGPYLPGHLRVFGAKAWRYLPGSEPDWDLWRFPFDMNTQANPLKTGGQQNTTVASGQVVVSALAFTVTEAGECPGMVWFHPGSTAKTLDFQLWNATAKVADRLAITVGKGQNTILWDTLPRLVPGVEYQVQAVSQSGVHDFTAQPGVFTSPRTDGIVTTEGITNPARFGTANARATSGGTSWRGLGPIVRRTGTATAAAGYLSRSGTTLTDDTGQTWRGIGVNWHIAALSEAKIKAGASNVYPTHAQVDEVLDEIVTWGPPSHTVVRPHTLGISAGLPQSLVTGVAADGTLSWNAAAWEPIDYVVAGCRARGLRCEIVMDDIHAFYHKGRGWWVQQAFLQRATSAIPSTYTYTNDAGQSVTETGVTSYTPPTNTNFSGSGRAKAIEQQYYRNPWLRSVRRTYNLGWWNHVNQYSGIRNGAEPALTFAQGMNEAWDSGDQYSDHAGADGIAWAADVSSTITSVAPNVLVIDSLGSDGVELAHAPGRNDPKTKLLSYHAYNNHANYQAGYVTGLGADAEAVGKPLVLDEYAYDRTGIDTFLSEVERTPSIAYTAFWAIYPSSEGHAQGGPDDTVYVVGANNAGFKARIQAHAAVMASGVVPTPPVLTNLMQSAPVANCEAASSAYSTGASTGTAPTKTTVAGAGVTKSALRVIADAGYKWVYPDNPTTAGGPVTPGQAYTGTAHAKLVSGMVGGWYGHISWFKADGSYITGNTTSGTVTASGSYAQVTFTGTAPALAAYALPQVEFNVTGSAEVMLSQWGVFAGNNVSPWVSP